MKLFTATFLALLLASWNAALLAQDASTVPLPDAQPNPAPAGVAPAVVPGAQPSPTPLSLIPETPASTSRPHRSSSSAPAAAGPAAPVRKNKTEANTQDVADRVKFREAKTKALRDEKIQEQLSLAEAAKTEPEKRAALKRYYLLLYARILKIDGSIKKLVSQRQEQSLKQLDQSNVRPEEYQEHSAATH